MTTKETTPTAPKSTLNIWLTIFLPPLLLTLPFYNTQVLSFFIFLVALIPYAIGALSFQYYANKREITKASPYIGAGVLAALAISLLSSFLYIPKFFEILDSTLISLTPVCMLHSFLFWAFAVNKKSIYKIIAGLLYLGFVFLFKELVFGVMQD